MKNKWMLCKHKGYSFTITIPKTSNKYRFYNGRPLLIKNEDDLKYFLGNDYFEETSDVPMVDTTSAADRFKEKEVEIEEALAEEEDVDLASDEEAETKSLQHSKKELKKMKKSELREILGLLAPGRDSPARKENIVNLILEYREKA